MPKYCFYVCFCLWLIATMHQPAHALEKTDDIDTNRPSFMASPLVVPKGSAQIENGGLYQHFQHGQSTFDMPETEVRVGILKSFELQAFVPNYFIYHQQSSARTELTSANRYAVSDIQEAGFKYQLPSFAKNLNVAVIGGVTIPTGSRVVSGTGVQPVIRIPYTRQISKNWSVGGMQSILVLNAGHDVQWQNFCLVSRAFGNRTSAFIEYGGYYTHHAVWSNIAHFGVVRKINKNNQIDIQWGSGLNKTAPAAFVGVGYSFRFDRLPGIEKL